jgi:hypothetical protein
MPPTSPATAADFLRWKYFSPRPGWDGPRSYLLESGESIAAHAAAWPLTLIAPTGRHSAYNFIDWAADPSRQGSGVSILQRMARLADVAIVLGGSTMAQRILPAAGFKPSSVVRGFARPLRPLAQLALSWRWNWKAPARLARNVLRSLAPPLRPVAGWSLERVHPHDLAAILGERDQCCDGVAKFSRTPEMLKYYFECPIVESQAFLLRHDGREHGYCVVSNASHQARIVDAWVRSDTVEEWRALFGLCLLRAVECAGAYELVTATTSHSAALALKASGFIPRGSSPLTYRSLPGVDLAAEPVFMQMIDCDAAFRNEGTPHFWS